MVDSALAYEYVQLVLNKPSIRLVQILPGSGTDRIEVRFLETEISKSPDFVALSYAWGDPTPTARIYVDHRYVPIATNLSYAMKRLRHEHEPGSFWIDALSINQGDDAEKADQIPLMRQIYRQAHHVVIYLGEEQDNSSQIPGLFQSILGAAERQPIIRSDDPLDGEQQPITWDRYQALGLPEFEDRVWDSVRKLVCRPWFRRVWVLQEAVLPTKATMVCGTWDIDLAVFLEVYVFSYMFKLPNFSIPKASPSSSRQLDDLRVSLLFVQFLLELRSGKGDFVPWKCIDLLQRSRMALAAQPHDYCYALLGLSEEIHDPGLVVDYSVSAEEVFKRFAKHFVERGDGVQLLCSVTGQNPKLPSWVPDWSCRELRQPTISPEPGPLQRFVKQEDKNAVASIIYLHPSMHDTLVVRGVIFDRVDKIGQMYTPIRDNQWKRAILARINPGFLNELRSCVVQGKSVYGSLQSVKDVMEIADWIDELCSFLGTEQHCQYPNGEEYEEIIEKTMRCGRRVVRPSLHSASYRAFIARVEELSSWRCPHLLSSCGRYGREDGDMASQLRLFEPVVKSFCMHHRRGRTSRGYVGQFVPQSQEDDLVFIPLGSPVPLTIRPNHDVENTYKLVGECYVHGMMNGEAFDEDDAVVSDINIV